MKKRRKDKTDLVKKIVHAATIEFGSRSYDAVSLKCDMRQSIRLQKADLP